MKRLSFFEALCFALALSAAGTLLSHVLSPWFGVALISRGLCTLLGLAYVLFLLIRSRLRRGRVSLLMGWLCAALAIAVFCPSLLSMAAAHLTLIWLTRALLFHTSLLTALADLAVSALSLAAGCWALLETGSVFASLWSLGLMQAGCALLPLHLNRSAPAHSDDDLRFSRAARTAEQALRALASSR